MVPRASCHSALSRTQLQLLIVAMVTATTVAPKPDYACPAKCYCEARSTNCSGAGLNFIPPELQTNTQTLILDNNHLFSLQTGAFKHVPRTRVLSLARNRISHVHPRALAGLGALRRLNLAQNQLSSLPTELFLPTPRIIDLDVSHNSLYFLPHAALEGILNLRILNVSHNHISSAYLGDDLQPIETLDISYNTIPRINTGDFVAMKTWNTDTKHFLNLSHCNIMDIVTDAFKHLGHLTGLSLAGNNQLPSTVLMQALSDLPANNLETLILSNLSITALGDMFRSNKYSHLSDLDLSGNQIQSLNTGELYNLDHVRVFDLSNNIISVIHSFKGASDVQVLNLSRNRLQEINFTFDDTQSLRELYLAHNQLSRLTGEPFQNLFDLSVLDVSYNRLATVEISLGFEQLSSFALSHNALEDISFVQRMPRLEILHASYNHLTSITADTFSRAVMLKQIDLCYNEISQVAPVAFAHTSQLQVLDMSHNQLQQLAHYGWMAGATLETLSLSHNNLSYIAPSCLQNLNALRFLDLAHAGLYGFPLQTFSHSQRLQTLNISHNRLALFLASPTATQVFAYLDNLKKLDASSCDLVEFPRFLRAKSKRSLVVIDLSHNQIASLSVMLLQELTALRTLNLAHNQLTSLGSEVMDYVTSSLQTCDLSHNPYQCSCDLKPLCDWLKSKHAAQNNHDNLITAITTPHSDSYVCKSSAADEFNLQTEYCSVIPQQCETNTNTYIWAIAGILVLLVFVALIVVVCKYYMRKRKKRNQRQDESHAMAAKNGSHLENEKMMYTKCNYTKDNFYKEDML